MPSSVAAVTTARSQDCLEVVLLIAGFFLRFVRKPHVLHIPFDEKFVLIGSAFKDAIEIQCVDPHTENADLPAETFVVATRFRGSLSHRPIGSPTRVSGRCQSIDVSISSFVPESIGPGRVDFVECFDITHFRRLRWYTTVEPGEAIDRVSQANLGIGGGIEL